MQTPCRLNEKYEQLEKIYCLYAGATHDFHLIFYGTTSISDADHCYWYAHGADLSMPATLLVVFDHQSKDF